MTITIEQLRRAVLNDYAKLVYDDGGTQADEISLADYKLKVPTMTYEELVGESWYIEGHDSNTLESYIETFDDDSYAECEYKLNDDGSTEEV